VVRVTLGGDALLGLFAGALAMFPTSASAQTAGQVTITFRLTVNFNFVPAKPDTFAVKWTGGSVELCGPCTPALSLGGGRSIIYEQMMNFPKGSTETFVFARMPFGGGASQQFGSQAVTPVADRTVTAFFTYGASTVSTPSTGSGVDELGWLGVGVIVSGVACLGSGLRRRPLGGGRRPS
jgi:hypothetical protein